MFTEVRINERDLRAGWRCDLKASIWLSSNGMHARLDLCRAAVFRSPIYKMLKGRMAAKRDGHNFTPPTLLPRSENGAQSEIASA